MLQRITDSIILCPSREAISVEHKSQRSLNYGKGELDVWVEHRADRPAEEPSLFVLKFGGAGSRAERMTVHPLDCWMDLSAEIWGVNWPGFGSSSGQASVRDIAEVGVRCYEEIRQAAGDRPVVVTGNSLGTAVALHVAACFRDMAGIILRNPPPLRQLIVGKHGWYSGWIGAWLISRHIPTNLDSIANARSSDVPAVFVTSGKDRIVPPAFQRIVYDAYAGPKRQLILPQADHATFLTETEQATYFEQLKWLRSRIGLAGGNLATR